MKIDDLYGITMLLLMVAMVVGVGVLVLDKTSQASYLDYTVTNETFTWANETNATLNHGNLTSDAISVYYAANGSEIPSTDWEVFRTDGMVYMKQNTTIIDGGTAGITYEYREYDTAAASALDSGRDAVGGIATNWMDLVVTISILAIILGLVITAFVGRGRR